jgi:hemerythrin superfamily protein
MDPVKLIKQDHRTVRGLFRAFERASAKGERQRIAEEIIEELSVHTAIEEQLVYPLLRQDSARSDDQVLNALEEHHGAKLVLAELDKMKADAERFAAKMHFVREAVELHMDQEEASLLPRLEKLLGPEDRSKLADAMREAKKSAPNHPHPSAPDTPPAGLIAGLLAKMTDAGKDLIRKVIDSNKAAGHRRVVRRASVGAQNGSTRRASAGAQDGSARKAGAARKAGPSRRRGAAATRRPSPTPAR